MTALVPLLIACGVTVGCSSRGPVYKVTLAITCGRVLDQDITGYFHHPLTVGRAVAALTGAERDGGAARIDKGTLSSADRNTLDTMAVELMGYSGNKLSDEAEAFAQAEQGYSPTGLPVNTAYAPAMERAIAALARDCPSPAPNHPAPVAQQRP